MERAESLLVQDRTVRMRSVTNDAHAIALCQAGNRMAYGFLVERYKERAYYSALGIVRSHEAALDLSQDAFVRAFRAIKRFDPAKKFYTWYYQILRNLCLNFIRDQKRHAKTFSEVDETIRRLTDETQDASVLAEQNELKKALWEAMDDLKPQEREIIVLKDFQDLAYKDIAELLQIPIGTVMSRLFNARRALKAKLERMYL
ncbi:sigma-70 family RNA polymerase sigma factor [candidate division KSB1 bacterium]|nr:sigma-70 family RNA polymerase sigma factor [candidate division KSB1 bacterium]